MRIELGVTGISVGTREVRAFAKEWERAANHIDRAVAGVARLNGAGLPSGGGGGTGGGGGVGRTGGGVSRLPTGPRQQLAALGPQIREARDSGDQNALGDLLDKQFRLRRSIELGERRRRGGAEALQRPGLLELFGDMNGLLRGGIGRGGGGLTRAVGGGITRMLGSAASSGIGAAGGGLAALGPVGAAVTAGLAGLTAGFEVAKVSAETFAQVLQTASANLQQIGNAATISGGNAGQVMRLRAMGINPSEAPQLAAQLRERITTDPAAQMAAGRLGIRSAPGRYGDPNHLSGLEQLMTTMRGMPERQRLDVARSLQMENVLPGLQVSDRVWKAQRADIDAMQGVANPAAINAARDYAATLERITTNFEGLTTIVGAGMFGPVIDGLTGVADGIRNLAVAIGRNPEVLQGLGDMARRVLDTVSYGLERMAQVAEPIGAVFKILMPVMESLGALARGDIRGAGEKLRTSWAAVQTAAGQMNGGVQGLAGGVAQGATAMVEAQRAHTAAMYEHARALRTGTFGGGDRARNAIPSAWKGYYFERALDAGTIQLGALNL